MTVTAEEAARPRFVYTFTDAAGTVLYVGCTVNFGARLASHQREREWFKDVDSITVQRYPDYHTGMAAEWALIRALDPIHNRALLSRTTRVVLREASA